MKQALPPAHSMQRSAVPLRNTAVGYVDKYDGSSKALSISTDAAGNYLELPKGLLNGKDAATFSFWIKPSQMGVYDNTYKRFTRLS